MGAKVTALERSPRRAEFLVRNLGRLTLDAEIVVADALEWQAAGPVRRGPARRALHRHRHDPPPSRRALGQVAGRRRAPGGDRRPGCSRPRSALLEPGGVLVYAVCSLQPEEGPQRIEALLAGGAPVERSPIAPRRAEGPARRPDPAGRGAHPALLISASLGGLDGFFIARLKRRDG